MIPFNIEEFDAEITRIALAAKAEGRDPQEATFEFFDNLSPETKRDLREARKLQAKKDDRNEKLDIAKQIAIVVLPIFVAMKFGQSGDQFFAGIFVSIGFALAVYFMKSG